VTTPCVLNELRVLGNDFSGTAIVAKKTEKRRCNHSNIDEPTIIPSPEPTQAGLKIDIQKKNKQKTHFISPSDCLKSLILPSNKHRYCIATQDQSLRSSLRKIPGVPLIYIKNSVLIFEPASDATKDTVKQLEREKLQPLSFETSLAQTITPPEKKKRKNKNPNPLSVKISKEQKEMVRKERNRRKKVKKLAKESDNAPSSNGQFVRITNAD
jgi:U3 small nucleolar RNA-associated protein 23